MVLPIDNLTEQVIEAKKNLAPLGIPVTVSELAYGAYPKYAWVNI